MEKSLRRAALWEEVKDKLNESAHALSGGQQQRLCIARGLAVDPGSAFARRALLRPRSHRDGQDRGPPGGLKDQCTIVIVTHNMQQAARVADITGFFLLDGKLIEHSETSKLFTTPTDPRTEAYITGRFG